MWYTGLVPELYKRKPNTKCIICSKPVYKRPAEIKKNRGNVFCSMGCYGIHCRNEKPCTICGKLILSSSNKKTCSRACANRHRAGIKYKLNRPKDKVHYYKGLKTRLLEKRGRRCERCRYSKYQILQIHHRDRNKTNNELSNLELICPNCHAEEHYLENSWLN